MDNNEDLKLLFSGSEIDTNVLKEILEDNGIGCVIRNDMNSAKAAGFGVGYGSAVHVLVMEKYYEQAKKLLAEFQKSFEQD